MQTPENEQPEPNDDIPWITPQNVTDQQRTELAAIFNRDLETESLRIRMKLSESAKQAAAGQDGEALKRCHRYSKAYATQLSRWNESPLTSELLKLREQSFNDLADDIQAALGGELPGQEPDVLPGDEWMNPPRSDDENGG